jgi:acetyl esterase/lipase
MRRHLTFLLGLFAVVGFLTAGGTATAAQPARSILDINYNEDEIGPLDGNLNSLDLYLPASSDESADQLAPLVVWIHGGGFMNGDKRNKITNKAKLFNDLGYAFASLNYRLSPDISENCCEFAPDRIMAPDHISDVAEAIGWLSKHIRSYGGDPDAIILAGHSAGAQLVSLVGTSPAWIEGRQVSRRQIIGAISLDTDTFDVRAEAADTSPFQARMLAWNAFGTPTEEAANPRWDQMSPALYADPSDPPFLFVTQATKPNRIAANQDMAARLGQDPSATVVGVPYDHEGINDALGSPTDTSVETERVSQFVRSVLAAARPAGVKVTRRPGKKVVVKVKRRASRKATKRALRKVRRKVTFAFEGTDRTSGFQCRIDRHKFGRCHSPRKYRLKPGSHTFRIKPLYPSGRPGNEKKVTFKIVARTHH